MSVITVVPMVELYRAGIPRFGWLRPLGVITPDAKRKSARQYQTAHRRTWLMVNIVIGVMVPGAKVITGRAPPLLRAGLRNAQHGQIRRIEARLPPERIMPISNGIDISNAGALHAQKTTPHR